MDIIDIIDKVIDINKQCSKDPHDINDLEVNLVVTDTEGNTETFGFSDAASWRGVYAEPCLFAGNNHSLRDLIRELSLVSSGIEFNGWKGGRFSYGPHEQLNFEHDHGVYSGDGYFEEVMHNPETNTIDLFITKLK